MTKQDWRRKPSNNAKAAAMNLYSPNALADLADDLEAFEDVKLPQRKTAEQIASYQEACNNATPVPVETDEELTAMLKRNAPPGYTRTPDPVAVAVEKDEDEEALPNPHMRARFTEWDAVNKFLHGGKAVLTVVSKKSGTRFTYRFTKPKARPDDNRLPPTFVSVLSGPDNNTQYSFIGSLFPSAADPLAIRPSGKSKVSLDAPSAKAAQWFVRAVAKGGDVLEQCEIWHEGRCGRCGRRLTVPESIESGFGPECINHV